MPLRALNGHTRCFMRPRLRSLPARAKSLIGGEVQGISPPSSPTAQKGAFGFLLTRQPIEERPLSGVEPDFAFTHARRWAAGSRRRPSVRVEFVESRDQLRGDSRKCHAWNVWRVGNDPLLTRHHRLHGFPADAHRRSPSALSHFLGEGVGGPVRVVAHDIEGPVSGEVRLTVAISKRFGLWGGPPQLPYPLRHHRRTLLKRRFFLPPSPITLSFPLRHLPRMHGARAAISRSFRGAAANLWRDRRGHPLKVLQHLVRHPSKALAVACARVPRIVPASDRVLRFLRDPRDP